MSGYVMLTGNLIGLVVWSASTKIWPFLDSSPEFLILILFRFAACQVLRPNPTAYSAAGLDDLPVVHPNRVEKQGRCKTRDSSTNYDDRLVLSLFSKYLRPVFGGNCCHTVEPWSSCISNFINSLPFVQGRTNVDRSAPSNYSLA